ncbi:MAG: U32 family peptidase [Firmicutes bacterium]|nr:U32 family peptidase [Bacillota bacterium]
MKKPELLSPAGNMQCLKAAILAGCDAVYLGGYKFGARNFAHNFNNEELVEAVNYAHLYGVKVYVTVNTIIYENEVNEFMDFIEFLYINNVDALIIQDIGMLDLIRKTYPNFELHASTQMHIHNLEGAKLIDTLGVNRYVIARETDFETIKNIRKNTKAQVEVFVHGALCISYSGQCLMSSLIGGRSGNRGSCAGSCRLQYDFINNNQKLNKENYILSTKDLNSLENIGLLIDAGIDSFKLEGRMKSPSYVYIVTSLYRKAIDSYLEKGKVEIDLLELQNLKKIFNRLFTKGFLFKEENNNLINTYRPNHLGIEIGKVIEAKNNEVVVKLADDLSINDGIRFIGIKDSGLVLTSMFKNGKRINKAYKNDIITIKTKDVIEKGAILLKTTDYELTKQIENRLTLETRKVEISGIINLYIDKPAELIINDGKNEVCIFGNKVEKSKTSPLSKNKIYEQLNKLGSTIYTFNDLKINMDENIFFSIKELNELRRQAVEQLNKKRMWKREYIKRNYSVSLPDFKSQRQYNILINNLEEYELIKTYKYDTIYINDFDTYKKIDDQRKVLKLERVMNEYQKYDMPLLVGELGSINYYKGVMTDFSLNVVNSYSVAFLHSFGIKRITLSYELNDKQIKELIDAYYKRYNKKPNLELIVYAHEDVMVSKFDLNKYFNVQGNSYLKDRFGNLYPIIIRNDLMHIYNYKYRYYQDYEKYFNMGINSIRFNILDKKDLENIKKEL